MSGCANETDDIDALRRLLEQERQARLEAESRLAELAAMLDSGRLATQDPLTGLDNRAGVLHRFNVAVTPDAVGDFAVIVLEIERFDRVNDAYGRAAGDRLISAVARRLTECVDVRDADASAITNAIVGRVGGVEFSIVIRGQVTSQAISDRIIDIMRALGRPFAAGDASVTLEANFGYCMGVEGTDGIEATLERAHIALKHAKERLGERIVEYRDGMASERAQVVGLEHRIRSGLNSGEFIAYFQPRIDVVTGEIVASEALVRWAHPERGLLMPIEFILVAEQSSLILDFGRKVLEQVLALQARCISLGVARPVSINISSNEFAMPDFTDHLRHTTEEAGIPPNLIEVELKESILTEDISSSARVLGHLRDLGFQIALDDFGTGQSSLGRLRDLPIDVLKLDRSFVSAVSDDTQSADILVAMVHLAEVIGARVVVEGVESDSQLSVVRRAGKCEVQGFLYSPAVDPDQFVHLLQEQPWITTKDDPVGL